MKEREGEYIELNLLFSLLIDSDKSQVGINQIIDFYQRTH